MENLERHYFFPGSPTHEKRYLEAGLDWLVSEDFPSSMCKRRRSWLEQQPVSDTEAFEFDCQNPKYPDDIQVKVVPNPIEKGKHFDVISLLSFPDKGKDGIASNYLVRSTNNDRVDIETLRGKFIMLCCFSVPAYRRGVQYNILQHISLASHELSDKSKFNFEMVVVAKMKEPWADDKAAFDRFVSAFSCLVVPFHHPFRRDHICKSLNFKGIPKGLVVGPDEIVVQDNVSFFTWFGVDAFPFTDERLRNRETEIRKCKSLEELLGRTPSDYLYKNGGELAEKVSISELKKKLVGLYLCMTGDYIPMLEKAYQHSQDQKQGFEIVLVYNPLDEGTPPEVFREVINWVLEKRKISWWVLPFNFSVCCRLCNLSSCITADQLFIVSPCGELVDPCGGLVIENFGISAYPFTREGLVKEALKRLEQHTLESLLEEFSFVPRKNDDVEVCVADLQGRNILLYPGFAKGLRFHDLLTEVYEKIKAKNPDFEVVFVCLDNFDDENLPSAPCDENLPSVPWLVFRPNPSKSKIVVKESFISTYIIENLVAFDKDGQICSIHAQNLLRSGGPDAFPFSGDLVSEIFAELDYHCGGEFKFNMVWSDSFMMDKKRVTTSRQKRAKRAQPILPFVGYKRTLEQDRAAHD